MNVWQPLHTGEAHDGLLGGSGVSGAYVVVIRMHAKPPTICSQFARFHTFELIHGPMASVLNVKVHPDNYDWMVCGLCMQGPRQRRVTQRQDKLSVVISMMHIGIV